MSCSEPSPDRCQDTLSFLHMVRPGRLLYTKPLRAGRDKGNNSMYSNNRYGCIWRCKNQSITFAALLHLLLYFIQSDLQPFIHSFTHRQWSQPRKAIELATFRLPVNTLYLPSYCHPLLPFCLMFDTTSLHDRVLYTLFPL